MARDWDIADVAECRDGIWLTSGAGAVVDYPDIGHEQLAAVENESPWYLERNRLIAEALVRDGLPETLIDVGGGNGVVAAHLDSLGIGTTVVEPSRGAAARAASRGLPTVCGLLADLRLPDASIEAIGMFDVLEHVEDPTELLREAHRVLRVGGRVALTVPAVPALWSRADELACHHRRYTRAGLETELRTAGFRVTICHSAFAVLVPAVALMRVVPDRLGIRRGDISEAASGTRQVAGYGGYRRAAAGVAFKIERIARRHFELRVGTSLVAVAVR